MQLQLRTDDDHGTAGVVDTLAEQVLTEAPLLALQQVRQRLQRTVARAGDRTSTAAVVEQRVDRLLQHALLVVHDDLGCTEVQHALETVVAVDHTTVEIVEVGGRETATVELHHRAQLRRDHRDGVEDHAGRVVTGPQERRDDLESLERTQLLLALTVTDDLTQLLRLGLEVEGADQRLDGLRTHAAGEVVLVAVDELGVDALVHDHLLRCELDEGVPDLVETFDLTLGALTDVAHLALRSGLDLALRVRLGTGGLELGQVGLELLGPVGQIGVAFVLDFLLLDQHLRLERGPVVVATFLVDGGDDVRREVDDLLEILRGEVEQVSEARRNALEVPDVGDRGGQFNMAHALTPDLGLGHLDAATLADDALVTDTLVLAAGTLPVAGRPEDPLAEQTVLLGLQGAVVDGLRLLDLAM